MRTRVIAMVVVGCLAGLASAQPAPDKAAAQAAYAEGQERYAAGRYLDAAARFEAAYGFDRDPVYLFNVAQAYRLGEACAKAATFYRRFLGEVPNPPNLAKVNLYLEQSDACAKAAVVEPVTPPPVDPPAVVVPPMGERPIAADPGRTKRWAGLGAVFVGGAVIGLGAYFTSQYGQIREDHLEAMRGCNQEDPCEAGYQQTFIDRGNRAETRAWISFGVGGAAVLGGIALYVLGRSAETSSVAVVPATGGAVAIGTFRF